MAVARPGDQMLVTGRSADGAWFRVYVPGPAEHDGWAPASTINLLADGSAVPIAGCAEVAAVTGTPGPTAVPATPTAAATPTATPTATATAKPTATPTAEPTATPTPTPTPNLGPRFTTQPYSDVAIVNTNPLGTGSCAYALGTGLTTKVSDTDGVSAIQLWVRKPGATSYKRFSHDFTNNGATWNDFINAHDDGVTTAGTLSWYALAIDGTGAKTKSTVRTIKIVRCDTEAEMSAALTLDWSSGEYQIQLACGNPDDWQIPWLVAIGDPDGVASAKLSYVFRSNATGLGFSGSTTLTHTSGIYWTGHSSTFHAPTYLGHNTLNYTIVSTDPYGGKSAYAQSPADAIHIYGC